MLGEEGENENSIFCMSSATIYVECVECQNNIRQKQVFHFRSQNIMARIFLFYCCHIMRSSWELSLAP